MKPHALLVTALVLGATSCRSTARQTFDGGDSVTDAGFIDLTTLLTSCPRNRSTQVRGLIGPDVNVRVPCLSNTTVPIATVDVEDDGSTPWSVSLKGDQIFVLQTPSFVTCQSNSPTLATAVLALSGAMPPGTTLDALATVTSDDGAFPTGEVNLHAEIITPTFKLDQTSLDFGDVLPGQIVSAAVNATSDFPETVAAPGVPSSGVFHVVATLLKSSGRTTVQVSFTAPDPGDYVATLTWTAGISTFAGCTATQTLPLHARVVAPDAGATDGSADGD
jgi:hypothetical protein